MRTRTVAALLGAVVALGMGVDLAGSAGDAYRPALVLTVHATPACAKPSPGAGRADQRHRADPAARRRLKRHCRRQRPSPDTTRTPSLVAPSARGGGR